MLEHDSVMIACLDIKDPLSTENLQELDYLANT